MGDRKGSAVEVSDRQHGEMGAMGKTRGVNACADCAGWVLFVGTCVRIKKSKFGRSGNARSDAVVGLPKQWSRFDRRADKKAREMQLADNMVK